MQQMGMPPNGQPIITNQMQPMVRDEKKNKISLDSNEYFFYLQAANAYITGVPTSNPYTSYTFAPGQLVPTTILGPADPASASATVSPQMTPCVPQPVPMPQQQKLPQPDRIEVSPKFALSAMT